MPRLHPKCRPSCQSSKTVGMSLLFLFFFIVPTSYAIWRTQTTLYKVRDGANYPYSELSSSWVALNDISCIRECKIRFPKNCTSVVYNSQTLACTPVHPRSPGDTALDFVPGDILYSQEEVKVEGQEKEGQEEAEQEEVEKEEKAVCTCDTQQGFHLYEMDNETVCIMPVSDMVSFVEANADCERRGSNLYIPHTCERFALLKDVSEKSSWVGLTKIGSVFVWQNGDSVEPDFYDFMWALLQPDNIVSEPCALYVSYFLKFIPINRLHDVPCNKTHGYVCEFNY